MHNVLTISRWHAGKKVLVFGHHQEVLNGLQDKFAKEQIGLVRIDGSTDTARRNAAAKQFQSDGKIMVALLSITAAGVRTRVLSNQSASAYHSAQCVLIPLLLSYNRLADIAHLLESGCMYRLPAA